jgi:hypothetical protein
VDKPYWQSKTFVFNLAVLLCTFAVDLPAELRALGVPEIWAVRVSTIANIGLRFISVAKITFSSSR